MARNAAKLVSFDSIEDIEEFLSTTYSFRKNVVLHRTEFRKLREDFYSLLTDTHFNSIFRALHLHGYRCTMAMLKSILDSDFVVTYNPFLEYFNKLAPWNRQMPDYIHRLTQSINTTCPEQQWATIFKKWIVGVVACAVDPKNVNHQVLVLVGNQGIGKTQWLNRLLPIPLKDYLYCGLVNPNNKDTLINLSENLLINLDELENLNKSELGSLKALITQSSIRLRKPYGTIMKIS